VSDFLDEKHREINARLAELKPAVEEYNRLEAAVAALEKVGKASLATATIPGRRGPGRPPGSASSTAAPAKAKAARKKRGRPKKVGRPPGSATKAAATATRSTKRRAGRRKGSGTRALEAVSFVQGQPGITIPELAAKMGIKQNYLYRVLPSLEQEGKLSKQGRGWHPKT
jgi:hypothetical protein